MANRRSFIPYFGLTVLAALLLPCALEYASHGVSCFLKWSNCIIVNAQPFYRRAEISAEQCMTECRAHQSGKYTCRSLVYDNVNHICDLFAHVGNAYPAKLVRYYGRDYYEISYHCINGPDVSTPAPTPVCPSGKMPRFVRTDNFMLQGNGQATIPNLSREQCLEYCRNQKTPDGPAICRSVDYVAATRMCMISQDAASPTGTGTLIESPGSTYYEMVCIPDDQRNCAQEFERLPQMILVGFAESTVTVNTYQDCIHECLKSKQRNPPFNCQSIMFYYSATEDNCILNSATKDSPEAQGLLTTPLDNDQVDYIQLNGCNTRRRSPLRRAGITSLQILRRGNIISSNEVLDEGQFVGLQQDEPESGLGEWTQWTPCDQHTAGRRFRYKVCGKDNVRACPTEVQWCADSPAPLHNALPNYPAAQISANPTTSPTGDCPVGACCPFRSSCSIGIMKLPNHTSRWCARPCDSPATPSHAQ